MFIYIFLFFLLLVILLFIIVKYTTIQLEIHNFNLNIPKSVGRIINEDYKIIVKLYLFKKFKYSKIILTKDKLEKIKDKNNFKKLETKIMKRNIKFNLKKVEEIKKLKVNLNKLDLQIIFGLKDAAKTAILTGGISSIIAIILSQIAKKNESLFWKVTPLYKEKDIFNIFLNCTIQFNLINIFYLIYSLSHHSKSKLELFQ